MGLLLPALGSRWKGEGKMGQVCGSPGGFCFNVNTYGNFVSREKQNKRKTKTNSEAAAVGVGGAVPLVSGEELMRKTERNFSPE